MATRATRPARPAPKRARGCAGHLGWAEILFYAFQTQAQAFETGLLVRADGDTLRGEIENDFWAEPPAFIRFRAAPGGSAQGWQPRRLRAVSFTHERYFRYEAVPIDHAAEVQLARLPRGHGPDVRTDSLLTKVLVEGPTLLLRVVSNGMPVASSTTGPKPPCHPNCFGPGPR